MHTSHDHPKLWLEAEYLQRRQKNAAYSLRAFSRLLDLPSGRVSQLLSQKRMLTPKLGKKIASRLGYDPERTNQFLACIEDNRKAHKKNTDSSPVKKYQRLDMDQFHTIAEPLHFSLLSLMETDDFSSNLKEIGARLGVSPVEARSAMERLQRLGLVKKEKNDFVLANSPGLTTGDDIRSSALREAHKRVLANSAKALEEIALELRDVSSITMAIDPHKLDEAKTKIRNFRRSLCEFLESGKKSEVYQLNIQLIPVSKRGKK